MTTTEVESALTQQRDGIERAVHDYADDVYDLIDNPNSARCAFAEIERIIHTFTEEHSA